MATILNKKRPSPIKSFLGETPTKVLDGTNKLSDKEGEIIYSVNKWLLHNTKPVEILPLNLTPYSVGIANDSPIIYIGEDTYLPIKFDARGVLYNTIRKTLKSCTFSNIGMFYIQGIGRRPDLNHMGKHLLKLLSSEYPGSTQIALGKYGNYGGLGRYVVDLNNANKHLIHTFLNIAIEGNGEVIDYTWIAPFQNILEDKTDKENKKNSKGGKKGLAYTGSWGEVHDDDQDDEGPLPDHVPGYLDTPATLQQMAIQTQINRQRVENLKAKIVLKKSGLATPKPKPTSEHGFKNSFTYAFNPEKIFQENLEQEAKEQEQAANLAKGPQNIPTPPTTDF